MMIFKGRQVKGIIPTSRKTIRSHKETPNRPAKHIARLAVVVGNDDRRAVNLAEQRNRRQLAATSEPRTQ
ncbi:MAG: hypothetical protein FWD31_04930 [Planctomycetaceae bacterium]|nr:hypothetical protein [Planctomycetaceae bacterium]